MDTSDDSIFNPKLDYNDSIGDLSSSPRLPALHPNDLFESNTAEIEEIKKALPRCDDSGTQLNTTSQLANLFNDDSFKEFEPKSENVSEPVSGNQIFAQLSLNMFTTGDLQSKLKRPSTIKYNKDLFADLDGELDSKKDKSNRFKGLAMTGKKRVVSYGNMSKISKVADKNVVEKNADDSFEFSEELTSEYFMPSETQKAPKSIANDRSKPIRTTSENDDEFDFSMYKKPSKSTFKPPLTLNKTSTKTDESDLVKQFNKTASTSFFTTGTGSSISLPGYPPLNNSKVPIPASVVFASPKNPLEGKNDPDKKAFAAAEGRKQPLVEISPNLLASKSPAASNNVSLDNSLSQCLFNNVSPVYRPKGFAETKEQTVNKISKNIFKGFTEKTPDDAAPNAGKSEKPSFPGFKTFGSYGGDVKIDDAAIKHVKNYLSIDTASKPTFAGFQTAHGIPMEIDKKAFEAVQSTLNGQETHVKSSGFGGSGFGGFQTAHGVPMEVDQKALQEVKGTLNKEPSRTLKFVKDQERSHVEMDSTHNTTAEYLNAKMDLILSTTSSKSNMLPPEMPPGLATEVTCSSPVRSVSPSTAARSAFFENTKKDLKLKSKANELLKPKISLPKPEFMIKPSLKRKSDKSEVPAKRPKSCITLEYPEQEDGNGLGQYDIMRAQILREKCRDSRYLPRALRLPKPQSIFEEIQVEKKIEATEKENKEAKEKTSQTVGKPYYSIYQSWACFVNPESDNILHRLTLIADELNLKERRLSLLERGRPKPSTSFAVPVKAPKSIAKHSTPKVSRILKEASLPGLGLSPIIEKDQNKPEEVIIIDDDEFDMELDDELDSRIMSEEEIERLNALVSQIEENISLKTRKHADRYGERINRKKYHREKGETVALKDLTPKLNAQTQKTQNIYAKDADNNFNLFDFYTKEALLDGVKAPDGGIYSCAADGTFGTKHIRRTLLSSSINSLFHPKLNLKWVENHVKLVKQKLAGYHKYLDHQLFGLIFDPDELLFQLRFRADSEYIDGKRSLIVKISEQDVAPTMPAVLYISSKQPLRLSDGWYEINCTGDSLIEKRLETLSIGSKILVCGATLSKSVQAAHPLESLSEINISANSTKRVKWHTKLGPFYKNVPPSTLTSVSSVGNNIFKLKLKIVRKYPDIWIQDNPAKEKRRAIFSKRQRDRWHAQKDKNMDLQRENLAANIKKKHRDDLDEDLANLTLKEIAALDDPEDIYTAVTLSKDPEDTVSNLTEEQRKKYQKFAEKQNFKINESFRREHQQSAASTTKKLRFKVKEGNRQSILEISENKLPENLRAGSVVIVECANITYGGKITLQKHGRIRAIEQETPRAELPKDFAKILPELASTITEVDIAGLVVALTPNSCVLADNKKQYVSIQLSNTWNFEALDKIVIVGAVLAFKNLEIDREKAHHLRFTTVSEVLSQVSDFNGSRGAIFNLFNALCKVFTRSGHENAVAAYRSSANASLASSPAHSRSSSSTPSPRAELPKDFANILPELASTITEVDIVGLVVALTPNSCVLADNKKQYVSIQLSNTWNFEALDKIVIVGAVLAFKNLEIDRQKAHHLRFTTVSEVLSQVSDFNGSRGAIFNLFNALCKVFTRSGHENAVAAYRSSANALLASSPAHSRSSSSTRLRTPANKDRMRKLEMSEDKWSRSNFSFNQN